MLFESEFHVIFDKQEKPAATRVDFELYYINNSKSMVDLWWKSSCSSPAPPGDVILYPQPSQQTVAKYYTVAAARLVMLNGLVSKNNRK